MAVPSQTGSSQVMLTLDVQTRLLVATETSSESLLFSWQQSLG